MENKEMVKEDMEQNASLGDLVLLDARSIYNNSINPIDRFIFATTSSLYYKKSKGNVQNQQNTVTSTQTTEPASPPSADASTPTSTPTSTLVSTPVATDGSGGKGESEGGEGGDGGGSGSGSESGSGREGEGEGSGGGGNNKDVRIGGFTFDEIDRALGNLAAVTAWYELESVPLHVMSKNGIGIDATDIHQLQLIKFKRHPSEDLEYNAGKYICSHYAERSKQSESIRADIAFGLVVTKEDFNKDHFYLRKLSYDVTDDDVGSFDEDDFYDKEYGDWRKTFRAPNPTSLYDWFIRLPSETLKMMIKKYRRWSPLDSGLFMPALPPSDSKKRKEMLKALLDYIANTGNNFYIATNNPLDTISYKDEAAIIAYLRFITLAQDNFIAKEWVNFVDRAIGKTAGVDERICLPVKSYLIPPVSMHFAPHNLIITNAGTGKSVQFAKVGTVFSSITRATLRGFSTADRFSKRLSIFANRNEPVIVDQVESLTDKEVLADLFFLMDTGSMRVGSAGVRIDIDSNAPITLLGNPPDVADSRYSFYRLFNNIAQPAIARRFSLIVFDTEMKNPSIPNAVENLTEEMRICRIVRLFYDIAKDKVLRLSKGLGPAPQYFKSYSLEDWLSESDKYIAEYKKTLIGLKNKLISDINNSGVNDLKSDIDKRIDSTVISFIDSIKENGRRMKALAVQAAIVDYLPMIVGFSLSETVDLAIFKNDEELFKHILDVYAKIHPDKDISAIESAVRDGRFTVTIRVYDLLMALIVKRAQDYLLKIIEYNTDSITKIIHEYIDLKRNLAAEWYTDIAEYQKDIIRALISIAEEGKDGVGVGVGGAGGGVGVGEVGNRLGFRNNTPLIFTTTASGAIRVSLSNLILVKQNKNSNNIIYQDKLSKCIAKLFDKFNTGSVQSFIAKLPALFDIDVEIDSTKKDILFIIKKRETLKELSMKIANNDDFICYVDVDKSVLSSINNNNNNNNNNSSNGSRVEGDGGKNDLLGFTSPDA